MTNKLFFSGLFYLFLVSCSDPEPTRPSNALIIGIDISNSAPFLTGDDYFLESLYPVIERELNGSKYGDKIRVLLFGNFHAVNKGFSQVLSLRNRPDKALETIKEYLVDQRGKLKRAKNSGDKSTNIIAFLEFSQKLCIDVSCQFLIVSDGLEHSSDASAYSLLTSGGEYPEPSFRCSQCRLEFIGFGNEKFINTPAKARRLNQLWETWALKAGFQFI